MRVEQLEEALQIIKALWTQPQASFLGKHYQVRAAYCEPKPEPLPVIMVGAFKPKMLRLTARYADWWNVSSTGVEAYRRMTETFAQACAEVGRDPAQVRRSWCGGCACAPTEAEAKRLAGDRFSADNEEDFGFVGTPQQIVEQMRSFVELGVDYFMVDCAGFPNLTTLELLIHEVLPALNEQARDNRDDRSHNAKLELLWVHDAVEAQNTRTCPEQLWERWQGRRGDASPFGICLRPQHAEPATIPFPAWTYKPAYLPAPRVIHMGENSAVICRTCALL